MHHFFCWDSALFQHKKSTFLIFLKLELHNDYSSVKSNLIFLVIWDCINGEALTVGKSLKSEGH
jgi:hypothetical protein